MLLSELTCPLVCLVSVTPCTLPGEGMRAPRAASRCLPNLDTQVQSPTKHPAAWGSEAQCSPTCCQNLTVAGLWGTCMPPNCCAACGAHPAPLGRMSISSLHEQQRSHRLSVH